MGHLDYRCSRSHKKGQTPKRPPYLTEELESLSDAVWTLNETEMRAWFDRFVDNRDYAEALLESLYDNNEEMMNSNLELHQSLKSRFMTYAKHIVFEMKSKLATTASQQQQAKNHHHQDEETLDFYSRTSRSSSTSSSEEDGDFYQGELLLRTKSKRRNMLPVLINRLRQKVRLHSRGQLDGSDADDELSESEVSGREDDDDAVVPQKKVGNWKGYRKQRGMNGSSSKGYIAINNKPIVVYL